MIYKADLTQGSIKLLQSRIIADLLIKGTPPEGWKLAILDKNVLQAKSKTTATNVTRLIKSRLSTMGPDLWKLVRDGKSTTATHAIFAAAVKHSQLLADFLYLAVGEQYRLFCPILPANLWHRYIQECRERDPCMNAWSLSTVARMRSSVYQTLAQAGYIESTRSCRLQTVHIAEPVIHYLEANQETNVLRIIQVGP